MKINSKILIFVLAVIMIIPVPVSAGTTGKGYRGTLKVSPGRDNYNLNSDLLPEWLVLPDGVSEAGLNYSKDAKNNKLITAGSNTGEKWIIKVSPDENKATYYYYIDNVRQFSYATTASYAKVVVYDSKNKKVTALSGENFFNEVTPINIPSRSTGASAAKYENGGAPKGLKKARKNKRLSKRQIEKLAGKAGFSGQGKKIAVAVALAESGGQIGVVLCNVNNKAFNPKNNFERGVRQCTNGKTSKNQNADRGLMQINNYHNSQVKNSCSFNPRCNMKAAYQISNGGTQWQWWSTYKNGKYLNYL